MPKSNLPSLGNFRVLLLSTSILSFAEGLFMPFYIVFLQQFGGSIEQFGFSVGLLSLTGAITSYYSGKHSDVFGRKPLLIIGFLSFGLIVLAYTLITEIWQLYILQVLNGSIGALIYTMTTALLGDLTKKASRGTDIGKFHAVVGILAALAMMGGGIVVGSQGYKVIFYATALLTFLSTLILLYVKEK